MVDNLILLCSGRLGLIILEHLHNAGRPVSFVFTDRGSTSVVEYCAFHGIGCYAGNPRLPKAKPVIQNLQCGILLSVNYLFIVEQDLLDCAQNYAINFHGSLLPKYRGRTPHVWAIINGERETGITAHLMTTSVDYGDIVKQVRIPIEPEDTGHSILQKFNDLYPTLLDEVLSDIETGTVSFVPQEHEKATYFSKRTPEDGEINWNWYRTRIQNWVRAQAKPYPGAFTYYEGKKIIIHRVEYSDLGYYNEDPNGLLLQTTPYPIVKVDNGALALTDIEANDVIFEKGKIMDKILVSNDLNIMNNAFKPLSLRLAKEEDMFLIFDWTNDPITRENSFNSEVVPLDLHKAWFEKKLQNKDCQFFICYSGEEPIGQIRFERRKDNAQVISFCIAPTARGKGWGGKVVEVGMQKVAALNDHTTFVGYVKNNNAASLRIFQKLGYQQEPAQEHPDAYLFTLSLPPANPSTT